MDTDFLAAGGRRRACVRGASPRHGIRAGAAARHDRFIADTVSFVAFTNAPPTAADTSRRDPPDTVTFAGAGVWNGETGYRFEARATTRATPGRSHGWFAVTVTAPDGRVVATAAGEVKGGQIVGRTDAMSKR